MLLFGKSLFAADAERAETGIGKSTCGKTKKDMEKTGDITELYMDIYILKFLQIAYLTETEMFTLQ